MDALIFLGFLVALALAAPRWGYDSTDGVDSVEHRRRAAWLGGRTERPVERLPRPPRRAVRAVPVVVAPTTAAGLGGISL